MTADINIHFEDWVAEKMQGDSLFRALIETLEPDFSGAWQRIMRRLTQEEQLMGPEELANLAVKIAEELRDEGAVIDLGQRYGLSGLDLVLEGPSGNLAQGPLYDEVCDFIPGHAATRQDVPIEQAADEIKEHVLPLRNWRLVAYKHDLKTIFLSIRRSVGAERRYLHGKKGGPKLPGDPLIMF